MAFFYEKGPRRFKEKCKDHFRLRPELMFLAGVPSLAQSGLEISSGTSMRANPRSRLMRIEHRTLRPFFPIFDQLMHWTRSLKRSVSDFLGGQAAPTSLSRLV